MRQNHRDLSTYDGLVNTLHESLRPSDTTQPSGPFTNPLTDVSNFLPDGKRVSSILIMTWLELCIQVLDQVKNYSRSNRKPLNTLGV
jgi:hypothetical protein